MRVLDAIGGMVVAILIAVGIYRALLWTFTKNATCKKDDPDGQ